MKRPAVTAVADNASAAHRLRCHLDACLSVAALSSNGG